jgi:hypothetical protein
MFNTRLTRTYNRSTYVVDYYKHIFIRDLRFFFLRRKCTRVYSIVVVPSFLCRKFV